MSFVQSMPPIISEFRFITRRLTDNFYRYSYPMKSITERTAFGDRLWIARRHAKMTQVTAAKAVGMSQGTLGELEREGQGSSYTPQLASVYGVSAVWLATGKGEMIEKQTAGATTIPRSAAIYSTMKAEALTMEQLVAEIGARLINKPDIEMRKILVDIEIIVSRANGSKTKGGRQT